MIFDKFSNIAQYKGVSRRLATAINFLEENDIERMEVGRYEIDGDDIFFMVNQYETKPLAECMPETHKNYIDIQWMLEGEEIMGYLPFDGQECSIAYNPTKDVAFYALKTNLFEVKKGMFVVFFPEDIHQPCVMTDTSKTIKKVVVKVKVD